MKNYNIKHIIVTYKKLYHFFLAKESKFDTVLDYLSKTLTRGGTFWIKHTWITALFITLYVTYSYLSYNASTDELRTIYAVISLTMRNLSVHSLLFYIIGGIFSFNRELYFDYVSNAR